MEPDNFVYNQPIQDMMFHNSNLETLNAARQTWTDDQRINSPLLYHAELGRQ